MHLISTLALAGTAAAAFSRNPAHVNKRHLLEQARPKPEILARQAPPVTGGGNVTNETTSYLIPQNANTAKYAVNGSGIPDVNWDIGESYAGLMPIGGVNSSELFFWFVPSANELAGDEILIWLNGGPGCSSLEGFLQEVSSESRSQAYSHTIFLTISCRTVLFFGNMVHTCLYRTTGHGPT
jgi:carboxypeptidase D